VTGQVFRRGFWEPQPILVTGMPRSGTTWLARLLATAPGTALTGREPMNPRGRQYAMGGRVSGWARILDPDGQQSRALRWAHQGRTPLVYGRYGRRQWAAPLPGVRVVVKDPFAMLSMPGMVQASGAMPVLVYRHPAAALASYRRMGWEPDLEELRPIVRAHQQEGHPPALTALDLPAPGEVSPAEAMGRFWAALYTMALSDLPGLDAVVVAHEEIAGGGTGAARALFARLGLSWSRRVDREFAGRPREATVGGEARLHRFDRVPAEVAQSWREGVPATEVHLIEEVTAEVRDRLFQCRLRLSDPAVGGAAG
jgi:hypothetical protein